MTLIKELLIKNSLDSAKQFYELDFCEKHNPSFSMDSQKVYVMMKLVTVSHMGGVIISCDQSSLSNLFCQFDSLNPEKGEVEPLKNAMLGEYLNLVVANFSAEEDIFQELSVIRLTPPIIWKTNQIPLLKKFLFFGNIFEIEAHQVKISFVYDLVNNQTYMQRYIEIEEASYFL